LIERTFAESKSLSLNRLLLLIGLPKSTWYYWKTKKVNWDEKYQKVKENLMAIAREHPAYGYKRATSELQESYGQRVGKKVVLKLMRDEEIQILRKVKKPKPSIIRKILTQLGDKMNLVAAILAEGAKPRLFEISYTDFTELLFAQGKRKAQLMPIVEHVSKATLGWALGERGNTKVALAAWAMATQTIKKLGFKTKDLIVHHDQGPVYTGYRWLGRLLLVDKAKVSYALRGARDNPVMESFNGHFKEENRDLFWECQTMQELTEVVNKQMMYYNAKRRHSSLGNKAPLNYLRERRKHIRF